MHEVRIRMFPWSSAIPRIDDSPNRKGGERRFFSKRFEVPFDCGFDQETNDDLWLGTKRTRAFMSPASNSARASVPTGMNSLTCP